MKTIHLAAALSLALAACAAPPPAASRGPLPQPTGWKAVLIAGDDEEPAFDNAVDAMAEKLAGFGVPPANIAILKASGRDRQAARDANIVRAFENLNPAPGDGCFIFVTSHGVEGKGLFIKRDRAFLSPGELDDLLSGSCAARPTVVIASGCFSGSFADGWMPEANRVILTAAREDRPSFGCSAEREFTIFDACILESLARKVEWRAIMERARGCVAESERLLGVETPSSPQMALGADVGNLRAFAH